MTTLEGRAAATRVVLPQPVSLKFKDDVFLNDEIVTAEQSLVRLLLGGKAVVTVRERSSLTITEVPGLTTIEIASGKIAMAVARERLRPGEAIQIRTPNAIAGIRGTSLIVEVIRQLADLRAIDPNVTTSLGVFEGDVSVLHVDPRTRAPLAAPVLVGLNTKFAATGRQPATVSPFQPGDSARFQAGVTPSGPQHIQAANAEELATQAQATAESLLSALLDPAGSGALVTTLPVVSAPTVEQRVTSTPIISTTNNEDKLKASPPPPSVVFPSNIVFPSLTPFVGSTGAASVVQIPSGSKQISTSGNAISGNAFEVQTSTPNPAELTIPLLTATDGNLTVAGNLLNVLGTLSSTTTLPLLSLDPTTLTTSGDVVRVASGGTVAVSGPLVSDNGGTLNVGGRFIAVEAGGLLTSTGDSPLVQLTNTKATVGGDFLRVERAPVTAPGPVLDMNAATMSTPGAGARVVNGGTVTTTGGPFARLAGGSFLTADALIVTDGAGNNLRLAGLLDLSDSTAVLNAVMRADCDCHPTDTVTWTLGVNQPVIRMVNGVLALTGGTPLVSRGVDVGAPITEPGVALIATATGDSPSALAVGGTLLDLGGVILTDPNPQIQLTNTHVAIFGSQPGITVAGLPVTAAGPLLSSLVGSSIFVAAGALLSVNGPFTVSGPGIGPLLQFTESFVQTGGEIVFVGPSGMLTLDRGLVGAVDTDFLDTFFAVARGGTVSASTPSALIDLLGGSVTTQPGEDLIHVGLASGTTAPATLTLSGGGSLVKFTDLFGGSLNIGGTLLRVTGSSVTTAGTLLEMVNTDLSLSGRPVVILEGGSHLTTSAGPVIKITGGSLTADTLIGTDGVANAISLTGSVLDLANTTVTLGRVVSSPSCDCSTPDTFTQTLGLNEPVIRMSNSNLNLTGFGAPLVEFVGTDAAQTSQGGTALIATNTSGTVKTLSLAGPLLSLSGVTLTDPSAQIRLSGMTVTQSGSESEFSEFIEVFNLPTTVMGPLLAATDSTIHIDFDVIGANDLTSTGAGALIALQNSPLTSTGGGVLSALSAHLAGPLLTAANSPIVLGFDVISVGTLVSTGAAPLLTLSSSPLMASGRLFGAFGFLGPSGAALAGPLLDAVNSEVTLSDHVIEVVALTSTGTSPVIALQSSPLTSSEDLISGSGFIGIVLENGIGRSVLPGSASLQGSLLAATSSTVTLGGAVAFLGSLANTGTDPLVSLQNSPLTAGGAMVVANSVTLAGPLLVATASPVALGGPVLAIANLTSTGGAPLISLQNSPLNADGVLVIDSALAGFGNVLNGPKIRQATLTGPLLAATDSVVTLTADAIAVPRSTTLSSSTTQAFVSLSGSSEGPSVSSSLTAGGSLLAVNGGSADFHGPFLSAVRSDVTATTAVGVFDGGIVTTTGTSAPLLQFMGTAASISKVTAAGNFVSLAASTTGAPAPSMTLSGPLLDATLTDFVNGDASANARSFVFIADGATLKSTAGDPLMSLDQSTVNTSGGVFTLRRSGSTPSTVSTVELDGSLLQATGGSIKAFTTALKDAAGNPRLCCSVFAVAQGASFTSHGGDPLITLTGTSVDAGDRFAVLSDVANIEGETVTAAASLALSGSLLKGTGGSIKTVQDLLGVFRSSLTSTTADPLIEIDSTTIAVGGVSPIDGSTAAGRLLDLSASATTPASLSLQGPLFKSTNATITTTEDAFGVFNQASLSSTAASALISITGGSVTAGEPGGFFVVAGGLGGPPTVSLHGPLLSATGTTLANGDPTTSARSFMFIGDGATVSSITQLPLLAFEHASVNTSGNILTLRRSPSSEQRSTLNLAGPLLRATANSSFNTSSLGFAESSAACCSGFFIGQGGQLNSSTVLPLIELVDSAFSSGPDSQTGGTFFTVLDGSGVPGDGSLIAPSLVSLAGPLLKTTRSTVSALFSLISVSRSSLESSTAEALVQLLDGSQVTLGGNVTLNGNTTTTSGRVLSLFASGVTGTPGSAASVALNGPLLQAVGGTISATADLVGAFNGAALSSTTGNPFLQLEGTSTTLGALSGVPVFVAGLLALGGTGGPSGTSEASITLSGPLLSATDATIALTGSAVNVFNGGTLVTNPGAGQYPLVSLTGGSLTTGLHIFNLVGRVGNTQADLQLDPVTNQTTGLVFGTDKPIQHGGGRALLETFKGATVNASGSVARVVDAQLLAATLPALVNLSGGTSLTTGSHAVDLGPNAKLELQDLIRLTNSTMTVLNRHLVNVDASRLNLTGNLVQLAGGSTLNILNGLLLNVLNGGVASIGGSLINFTGAGNVINVTNSFVPNFFFTGVPVFVAPTIGTVNGAPNLGASPGAAGVANISITGTPIVNLGTAGTVNLRASGTTTFTPLPSGATSAPASLIAVQGTGGTIKIGQ